MKGWVLLRLADRGDFWFSYGMDQPPSLPPTSTIPPVKKGIPVIGWVGIGCGGLLLVAIILGIILVGKFAGKIKEFADNPEKAGAELVVSMNPELEKISQDDAKGEMTIRTKDGEEVTLSYKDIAEGKIAITDMDGNTTRIGAADLSEVPAWVPQVPDLSDAVSTFHSEGGAKIEGQFSGKTSQTLAQLRMFFEGEASRLGLNTRSHTSMDAAGTAIVTLNFSDDGKTLVFLITEKPGSKTLVNTNYTETK